MNKKKLYAPINFSVIYLFSTYILFIVGDISTKADNLPLLTSYVLSAYLLFYLGYHLEIKRAKFKENLVLNPTMKQQRRQNLLLVVGSFYLITWGVNQIVNFGGSDFWQVLDALTNPGAAYAKKFMVYEEMDNEGRVSRIGQILILSAVIFALTIPSLTAYWERLTKKIKAMCMCGVIVYLLSFMYIGTQKGLGDLLILSLAGWLVARARNTKEKTKQEKLRFKLKIIILVLSALSYMALNQSSRALQFGILSTMLVEDVSDSWLAWFLGDYFALGFFSILGYPSHGYIGLSFNIDRDFVFSYGAGFAPAFESYRFQYLGGENNLLLTYPYRTEAATGWPAGMYWSTAFPWFASDLTFFGVLPFMFIMGDFFARTWISCLRNMDIVALGALGQLFIFVAFLPANNQVLMSRQGLCSVTVLGLILILRGLSRFSRRRLHAN